MEFSLTHVLVAASTVMILLFVSSTVYSWWRLRHIPGPFSAQFTKWWFLKHTLKGSIHLSIGEVSERYGPVVRVGPNEVAISDPDDFRRVNGVRSQYTRSEYFHCLRMNGFDNIVSQPNTEKHAITRSKMVAGYAGKENVVLESAIDTQALRLVNLVERKYLSTKDCYKPVDFAKVVPYFTLDAISSIAFGEPFGDLDEGEDKYDLKESSEAVLPAMFFFAVFPWVTNFLQSRVMKSLVPSEADPVGLGKMIGIAKGLVAQRFGPDAKVVRDMLGSFINHGLTQEELTAEAVMTIIAGADTTAGAIRWLLYHILRSPRIHTRLLAELANPPIPISSPITANEARQMPYLRACISEVLRLNPPAIPMQYRVAPPAGDVLSGYEIPAGTWVGFSFVGIMRNVEIFGEDVKLYRPERWLEADPERLKKMEATVDLCFLYGKWQCLGKNIAWMELNKSVTELLRNFEMELIDPTVMKVYAAAVYLFRDLWVRVEKREVKI